MTLKEKKEELKKNDKSFPKFFIYPFFLVHMGIFGFSGFWLSYGDSSYAYLFGFLHGGFAIFIYIMFYLQIFGKEKVINMIIGAIISASRIISRLGKIISLRGKKMSDYVRAAHIIPGIYFVLYTFLIRHLFIDISKLILPKYAEKLGNGIFILLGIISLWKLLPQ